MENSQAQEVIVFHLEMRHGCQNNLRLGQLSSSRLMKKKNEFKRKWIHPDAVSLFKEIGAEWNIIKNRVNCIYLVNSY